MDALCFRPAGNLKMQFNDFKLFSVVMCNLFAVCSIKSCKAQETTVLQDYNMLEMAELHYWKRIQ